MLAFIAPLSPALRKLQQKKGAYRTRVSQRRSVVHDLVIQRINVFGNGTSAIPNRVTLLRPDPKNPTTDQLLIDHLPIPRDAWNYDPSTFILTWKKAYGGGHLTLHHQARGAVGNIGSDVMPCSVTGMAQSQYSCDVALNAGATYASSGDQIVGFNWNPTAANWQQANWTKDRLLLTLSLTNSTLTNPGQLSFQFTDQQTAASPWIPDGFNATLIPSEQNGQLVWKLDFQAEELTPTDQGTTPASSPNSVYPYWLQAVQDAWAGTINGVMAVDCPAPNGTLVGFQGQINQPTALGYYRTTPAAAPFGVFQGRLMLDGKPVADSFMSGHRLYWQNLDPQHQQRTGLPESGCLQFHPDGGLATDRQQQIAVQRLSSSVALEAISQHADLHPTIHQQWLALRESLSDSSLSITTLATMTQFNTDAKGNWYDAVQANVTQDLSDIMTSFIPSSMWSLLYPDTAQPTLSGYVAQVANAPVPGVTNPQEWYTTLSVAVLSQGLANSPDDYAQYFNAPRAKSWLQTQVAASAVYQQHAKYLFNDEWPKGSYNGETQAFLNDQIANAGAYKTQINQLANAEVADIKQNVVPLASDPNAKQNLINQVYDMQTYALNNNLFWAYQYYTYFLSSGALGQIGMLMEQGDSSMLFQWVQIRLATLTAIDPSGYFPQQYAEALNVYLGTSVLPNLMSLNDGSEDEDLSVVILEYLQTFVNNTQNLIDNADNDLQNAIDQIDSVVADENAPKIIQSWLAALRSFGQSYTGLNSIAYVAQAFVTNYLSTQYPKLGTAATVLGGIFMGAVVGMGIFNLFVCIKSWSQLKVSEKVQVVLNGVGIGLQIVGSILQRGVRIYAIFQVDGMTKWQRFKAFSKILAAGESDDLNTGLTKIGNTLARWLGDTKGSLGTFETGGDDVVVEGGEEVLARVATQATEEEVSFASKIFGNSLDEFIVSRLGPLMILAGIAYSIYNIATSGETGISLAIDIMNIVGGSLAMCALIGDWAVSALVESGAILADSILVSIVSGLGVLGILAALAGIALMLYELFKPPAEDPVEQFLDTYAKPAGFGLSAKAASIDYATSYANPDQDNLIMYGFSLQTLSPDLMDQALCCNSDGSISLKPTAAPDPSCVWIAQTDGLGMSQIFTTVQPANQSPVVMGLSQMSDGSVAFRPLGGLPGAVSILQQSAGNFSSVYHQGMPSVVTQVWLTTPFTSGLGPVYKLTSKGQLVVLGLVLQPVLPDAKGNYAPAQASGYLTYSSSGVTVSPNTSADVFCALLMSGIEPCFMFMNNQNYLTGTTPLTSEPFSPGYYTVYQPSTPMTYQLTGTLPPFLTFDDQTGVFTPNGNQVTDVFSGSYTLTVGNSLGSQALNFTITATSPPPPSPTTTLAFAV